MAEYPTGIMSSILALNICAIFARFKKNDSITKKEKEKHDEIVLLAKINLNYIKGLISRSLIDSYNRYNDFFNRWCVKKV